MDGARLVLVTAPSSAVAEAIARVLVGEGLAACVTALDGVRSTYRWQGAVEQAVETQLLIKTRAERLDALVARLAELHPYRVPECIAVPIVGGLPAYLDWIADSTAPSASAG